MSVFNLKAARPVDVHVGARMCERRRSLGLSQGALAAALGLTFQQVQKYENGTNRISVGRLVQIATVLGVEPMYFLSDAFDAEDKRKPDPCYEFLASAEGARLMEAMLRITDQPLRQAAVAAVEAAANTRAGNGAA